MKVSVGGITHPIHTDTNTQKKISQLVHEFGLTAAYLFGACVTHSDYSFQQFLYKLLNNKFSVSDGF